MATYRPWGNAMFAKARLGALTDGVFSVAMTLLVLDVRLLEDFHPANDGELLQDLASLWPKFLPSAELHRVRPAPFPMMPSPI